MGFKGRFHRKSLAPANRATIVPALQDEPSSSEQDLQAAWAELNEAARASGVISFRACSRTGESWQNPATVRAIAAYFRDDLADRKQAP
jgi:hypothetical protein